MALPPFLSVAPASPNRPAKLMNISRRVRERKSEPKGTREYSKPSQGTPPPLPPRVRPHGSAGRSLQPSGLSNFFPGWGLWAPNRTRAGASQRHLLAIPFNGSHCHATGWYLLVNHILHCQVVVFQGPRSNFDYDVIML